MTQDDSAQNRATTSIDYTALPHDELLKRRWRAANVNLQRRRVILEQRAALEFAEEAAALATEHLQEIDAEIARRSQKAGA